eukprot:CAMPEP_0196246714 /NCGR_PEP_ID=MMETSP0913-20130531/36393_1 /TAXON_ID=49265 /ORGANISM="Thalassiosira rotula, Strain GSO102" /LENGTH=67 /DNA_ID=CAMNT_0041531431 /DNA_START=226 /DNA_END=429 /DNA_ORIENTATION=-
MTKSIASIKCKPFHIFQSSNSSDSSSLFNCPLDKRIVKWGYFTASSLLLNALTIRWKQILGCLTILL